MLSKDELVRNIAIVFGVVIVGAGILGLVWSVSKYPRLNYINPSIGLILLGLGAVSIAGILFGFLLLWKGFRGRKARGTRISKG